MRSGPAAVVAPWASPIRSPVCRFPVLGHFRWRRWSVWLLAIVATELLLTGVALGLGVRPSPLTAGATLTAADLGPGWTQVPSAVVAEAGSCFQPASGIAATRPTSLHTAAWASSPIGLPFASETVASYPSTAAAVQAFSTVNQSLSRCQGFLTARGGEEASVTVNPVAAPLAQSQSAGYSVSARLAGTAGAAEFVLAPVRTQLVLLVYADGDPVDPARVAALGAAAAARLNR